ncbi:MAG: IS1182 family transposase [Rubrobacter sp.]|nr:IS1182 family transposase [Rubrobacter sp.]
MMGTKERNFSPLTDLSLEELVPKDNLYRRLEATLDLSFVRDLVRERYAASLGRPSVDPVVFFKLQLVLFFEGSRSERQLMEVVADRLSIRWYLGYDLDEPLPDHSSLTRIRERYGLEVFRRFFERIVELCVQAGLVWGEELYFDSTKVEANAAVDSLAPRWAVEAHLGELFDAEGQEEDEDPPDGETSPALAALPTVEDATLRERNAAKRDWISRNGRQDRSFKSGYRPRTSDSRASKTDPDASPMTRTKAGSKLGYQAHYVVDGGKARVVLNVLVTPSEVTENRPMLDLLWSTAFRWHIRPRRVTGDARYGTRQNVAALEKAGIRAYVAIPNFDFRDTGLFGPGHFRYDPENDHYLCPAGQTLRFQSEDHHNRRKRYRAKPSICNACELKARCTTSERGRMLYRPFEEDFYDRVRGYRGTFAYEKALRKRQVWIEPLFGEAKDWHGMRRFRLRRLKKVNTEALLIASGQNVKRLLAFGGRRPKKLAQAAALRSPTDTGHENGSAREHRSSRSWRPTKAFFNSLGRF